LYNRRGFMAWPDRISGRVHPPERSRSFHSVETGDSPY
jgi:hypothetical protein